jgi:hypothetical protein
VSNEVRGANDAWDLKQKTSDGGAK